jgi:hypothetical protein
VADEQEHRHLSLGPSAALFLGSLGAGAAAGIIRPG